MSINYPEAIMQLRLKLNITQEDLARILGVSFTSVNRWENGHYEPTKLAKLKIKKMLNDNDIKVKESK